MARFMMAAPGVALTALLVALIATGCGPRAGETNPEPESGTSTTGAPTVVVLSLDGFRHDYAARRPTPTFDRLAREGASLGRLLPPWPSQTFPGHASLATGVRIERHGIVNNVFRDRERGLFRYGNGADWYDVPPLWIHATRQGVRTHVYHWVGSEGAYEGVEPAVWLPYDRETTDETKIDTIIGWLEGPAAERPGLVMSYLRGCDRPGHHHGPDSVEVDRCIETVDATLGRLVDALARMRAAGRPMALLIVSDHGMTPTLGGLDPGPALDAAGLKAEIAATGPVAHIHLADAGSAAAARSALAELPHADVYGTDELPTEWGARHPTRTGDLVVVARPGYRFDVEQTEAFVDLAGRSLGHHGHDPTLPDMGAIFRAWGDGIAPGAALETGRAIDLVPTICRVTGWPMPEALDGAPLDALLTRP